MSYALITGASKGIGKALAEELARRKYDLLLVSRSASELSKVCEQFSSQYKVACHFLPMDLSRPEAPQKVFEWVEEHEFDLSILVNNAGYGLWGPFKELSLEEQNQMITVNIFSTVNLIHLFLPRLLAQKKAFILNVGSTSGYQAIPTLGIYSASKAFVISFTRSLYFELRGTSVSVSCLSPGGTKTDFIDRAGMPHMQQISDKVSMEPEAVAKAGIRGLFTGKREIIPGLMNKVGAFSNRIMPKALVEKVAAGIYVRKHK